MKLLPLLLGERTMNKGKDRGFDFFGACCVFGDVEIWLYNAAFFTGKENKDEQNSLRTKVHLFHY